MKPITAKDHDLPKLRRANEPVSLRLREAVIIAIVAGGLFCIHHRTEDRIEVDILRAKS